MEEIINKPDSWQEILKINRCEKPNQLKAFQEWFYGSVILDSQNNPLRLFHGTKNKFSNHQQALFVEQFGTESKVDVGDFGSAEYFTDDLIYAMDFTRGHDSAFLTESYLRALEHEVIRLPKEASSIEFACDMIIAPETGEDLDFSFYPESIRDDFADHIFKTVNKRGKELMLLNDQQGFIDFFESIVSECITKACLDNNIKVIIAESPLIRKNSLGAEYYPIEYAVLDPKIILTTKRNNINKKIRNARNSLA
jgi:hypothetical protein